MGLSKIIKNLTVTFLLLSGLTLLLPDRQAQDKLLYIETRVLMGTFVKVVSPDKRAPGIVFNEIGRIEKLLSKYNPQSEVSKLNESGYLKASPETFYIINKAKEYCFATNGAFDITIEPLMRLWGLTNKQYTIPKDEQIKETLKLIGSDKIILHDKNNVIQFTLSGMKIDLGAIAKGYALDCAANKLREARVTSCLINAGGQAYCLGNYFSKPWSVGIKDPNSNRPIGTLWLTNKSVSTSGNYRQYFLKDKKRYGHILDPRLGVPIDSKIASVTVISDQALCADALSTAVFVLGEKEGRLLEKRFKGVSIIIVEEEHVQGN